MALLIEMVVDLSMNWAEFLQRLHASKPLHGPFPSSKRLMRILRAIVEPTTDLLPVGIADLFHRRGISAKTVGDDAPRSAIFLHDAPDKLQRGSLVPLHSDAAGRQDQHFARQLFPDPANAARTLQRRKVGALWRIDQRLIRRKFAHHWSGTPSNARRVLGRRSRELRLTRLKVSLASFLQRSPSDARSTSTAVLRYDPRQRVTGWRRPTPRPRSATTAARPTGASVT